MTSTTIDRHACATAKHPPQETPIICEQCGEAVEYGDVVEAGASVFCSTDCAIDYGYRQCDHCGNWHDEDDGIWIDGTCESFCGENCANAAGYTQCYDCGEWASDNNIYMNRAGDYVCSTCLEDNYAYCHECGEYEHTDYYNFAAEMCDSCAEDGHCHRELKQYGYRPDIRLYGNAQDGPFMGVELETDSDYDTDRAEYVDALSNLDMYPRFWMTEDGSLDNGVEVTTHPMTLTEHINSELWENVRDVALANGYTSHNNGNCGLHIHVNRSYFGADRASQELGGYKLGMLVSRFEQELSMFSRRTDNGWCAYGIHRRFVSNGDCSHLSMRQKAAYMCDMSAHSQCVNYQHSATFELRIFRGTLKLTTLYASLAFAQGLTAVAKHRAAHWCECVDWSTLIDEVIAHVNEATAKTCLVSYLDSKRLR